jgi:hypothetical protein
LGSIAAGIEHLDFDIFTEMYRLIAFRKLYLEALAFEHEAAEASQALLAAATDSDKHGITAGLPQDP